jgi:hypothetical protein
MKPLSKIEADLAEFEYLWRENLQNVMLVRMRDKETDPLAYRFALMASTDGHTG